MIAPKNLKFKEVDKWKSLQFFPTISFYERDQYNENSLPMDVVLIDNLSMNEYKAELVDIISFKEYIPDIFARMCKKMSGLEMMKQLELYFPQKKISDFAFFLYQFKPEANE